MIIMENKEPLKLVVREMISEIFGRKKDPHKEKAMNWARDQIASFGLQNNDQYDQNTVMNFSKKLIDTTMSKFGVVCKQHLSKDEMEDFIMKQMEKADMLR